MSTLLPASWTFVNTCNKAAIKDPENFDYSSKGKKLANLYAGNVEKEKTVVQTWDGKDAVTGKAYKGDYKVRWSINDGYREFPVLLN